MKFNSKIDCEKHCYNIKKKYDYVRIEYGKNIKLSASPKVNYDIPDGVWNVYNSERVPVQHLNKNVAAIKKYNSR